MNAEVHQMFLPAGADKCSMSESDKINMVINVLDEMNCYYKIKVPGRLRLIANCQDSDFERVQVDLGDYVKPYLDVLTVEDYVLVPRIDGIAPKFLQVAINTGYKDDDRFKGRKVKTMSGDNFVMCVVTKEES